MTPEDIQSLEAIFTIYGLIFFLAGISVTLTGLGTWKLVRAMNLTQSAPFGVIP